MERFAPIAVLCFLLTSCYHVRTVADSQVQRDPNPRDTIVYVYFWGLKQPAIIAAGCVSGTLQEVQTSTNLGYALLTVMTLGIVCPIEVKYVCAKPIRPTTVKP